MEWTVLKYAPSYWDKRYHDNVQIKLNTSSDEYSIIENDIKQAIGNTYIIQSIQRNQNVHDLGQVLIREQLMAIVNTHQNYYRVRRYVTVKRQFLATALEYNLDHRRCGKSSLSFQKHVNPGHDEILLVVQVIVTSTKDDYVTPSNNSEYFIDYIVTMNN